jgi:hypothetical protein
MKTSVVLITVVVLLCRGHFSYADESQEPGKAAFTEEQELQVMYPD